ncbi:MAG: hypothetical protein JRI50_10005 [Deltaproteobacteria bacterium]|nr:hypothetical protein [Deltaproteobacteria bacterium]MBW2135644.1 hypothetical protein [Deltaproteobacteria bacterium]
METVTKNSNNGAAKRILGYPARKGGQATRRRMQTSGILRGGVDSYEQIIDLLIQSGDCKMCRGVGQEEKPGR